MSSGMLFSQAADRLYLSSAATGRVYDITALSATPATAIALPTPLTTPNFSGTPANASNLAVGYDAPGGNPANIVFIESIAEVSIFATAILFGREANSPPVRLGA